MILHADATSSRLRRRTHQGREVHRLQPDHRSKARPSVGSELPPVADLVAIFEAAGVTDASRVVIYGPALAATRTFFTLDYLGHKNVRILNGGLAAWKAVEGTGRQSNHGRWRDRCRRVPRCQGVALALHAASRPEVVAMADWISQRLESPQMALVDARPDAEFTGDDGGMNGMHPAGHLPGAKPARVDRVWSVARASSYPTPNCARK